MYSPIAFFAFNRPFHTLKTLKYLSKNEAAKETEIFAFIDGPRNNTELHLIDNVEKIINSFSNMFKKITISRSLKNLSADTNIRTGVSDVLSKYKSVIVLEDDICVSKYFLDYMNKALDKYQNNKEVWHINGFNFPYKSNLSNETFFTRSMECWGWGTWEDRWFRFQNDPLSTDPFYLISKFSKKDIREFNLDLKHNLYWSMVLANSDGRLPNTWDIFWYAFIFMHNGLCLAPRISLTRNIGHDGSGTHSEKDETIMQANIYQSPIIYYPSEIKEDLDALNEMKKYFNKKFNFKTRILNKLKRFSFVFINFLKKI